MGMNWLAVEEGAQPYNYCLNIHDTNYRHQNAKEKNVKDENRNHQKLHKYLFQMQLSRLLTSHRLHKPCMQMYAMAGIKNDRSLLLHHCTCDQAYSHKTQIRRSWWYVLTVSQHFLKRLQCQWMAETSIIWSE